MKSDLYTPLIENLTAKADFTSEQLAIIKEAFKIRKLAKKEYLLRPGQISHHLYFVSSGCLRVYTLEDVREIITQFGIKGWCVNDLTSYLTLKPATQFIQAIEPSV